MKGLLLKDFYLVKRNFGWFVLVIVGMLTLFCLEEDMQIFLIYPMVVTHIIPASLMAYDERDKWEQYSGTLPYTRAQLVIGKYLVGLCLTGLFFLLSMAVSAVHMEICGEFSLEVWLRTGISLLTIGCLAPVLILPVVFRFGAEKGQVVYLIILGILCSVMVGLDVNGITLSVMESLWGLVAVLGVVVVVYALSWRLSIYFYQKREL